MKNVLCALAILFCACAESIYGQSFVVVGTDATAYPSVVSRAYAFTLAGVPEAIADGSITATHDGATVPVSATQEPSSIGRLLSLAVMVDVSSSAATGTPTSLAISKEAALQAPSLLNQTSDEIALGMFDRNATLLHGLTTDKTAFVSALADLSVGSGSSLDAGLMAVPMGGLIHLQNSRYGRALLLIVDGAPSFNLKSALQLARAFKIEVYVVGVRTGLTQDIKDLADSTGGSWIENITTQADANAYTLAFVSKAKRLPASILTLTSPEKCGTAHSIAYTRNSVTRTLTYQVNSAVIPTLEWSESGIDFGTNGNAAERTVRITARGKAVTINGTAIDDNVFILVTPIPAGTVLQPDQSRDVAVRFTGAASSHFGSLSVTSDGCNVMPLYLRGGLQSSGETLELISPNGGETFLAGKDTVVRWKNALPADLIRLELSSDGGSTWSSVSENASGNEYEWTPGPVTSNNALMRIQRTIIDPSNIITLRGHRDPVYACAFTSNGQRVVTGGDDGTVRVWNAVTGVEERQLGTHEGEWVWAIATHPTLNIAASGGHDASVRIWDVVTGERIATIKADSRVWSVDFSPDGKYLAIGQEKSLMIISTSDWTAANNIAVPNGPVYSVRYSKTGNLLVHAESEDVKVRNATTWEEIRTYSEHDGLVYAVAITNDGTTIASGGAELNLRLWDAATGQTIGVTPKATGSILALDFATGLNILLVGGGDGTAKTYDVPSLTLVNSFAGHQGLVYGARFDGTAQRIVTAATDETARIWKIQGAVLAQDVSNATFRIVGGTPVVTDIQHGDVPYGLGNEKTTAIITNSGSDSLVIRSARLTTGDVDDFTIVTPTDLVTIGPGGTYSVETAFAPTSATNRAATINVTTGTGVKTVSIAGRGVGAKLDAPTVIDFGRHLANQSDVDSTIVLHVPQSISSVNVTRTTLVGSQAGSFSIISGGGSFTATTLNPHPVSLRFTPLTFGKFAARLEFVLDDGTTIVTRLYGEGTGDARITSSAQSILFQTNRCNSTPVEDSVSFTNTGTSTLSIVAGGIAGAHSSEFQILKPDSLPVNLEPQQKTWFKIRFTPVAPGQKDAKLVISSNAVDAINGTTTIPLIARKDSVAFELSRTSIHFDNVNEGYSEVQTLSLINTGTVVLRWAAAPIDLGDFRIESIDPQVTQPEKQSEIVVRFKGGVVGETYSASYTFVDSLCGRSEKLDMTASVKSYIGVTLSADTLISSIGGVATVPIRVSNKVNFDQTQITSINARIRVNGTILTPAGGIDKGTFGADGMRTFDVVIPIPQSGDVAMQIPFDVTWGNDTAAIVEFDSVWTTDSIVIRKQNGLVMLDNLCRQGGPRLLIRPQQSAAEVRIAPQPANTDALLELSVLEKGYTTVTIVDLTGRTVLTIVDKNMIPGSYLIPLDLSAFETGAYNVLLTTPTQHISHRLSVVR